MVKNQIKTIILLGLLSGLLLGIGQLLGGTTGISIALIFAILMNFVSYWFSDKIVLALYRARPIAEKDNIELYKIVREVANQSRLPMPKMYMIPSMNPNAFATGRNPKHAAVAFTEGILQLLSKDELKGVIAHEMSHIRNRDTLIQAVAATIATVISFIAYMARWGAIFGGMGRDDDNGSVIELLVLSILTPLIATLLQLAISRSREYFADETAAKTIHNPLALANALEKLEKGVRQEPMQFGNPTTSSLFILNPFHAKGLLNLLSTHPPIEERVKRLRQM